MYERMYAECTENMYTLKRSWFYRSRHVIRANRSFLEQLQLVGEVAQLIVPMDNYPPTT